MSVTTHPAVAEYVARIQAALADLPAAEVEEIVEDIGQHLSEVAGELGDEVSVEALSERLGTPEQYASELRAAAGYPTGGAAGPRAKKPVFAARFALWSLVLGVLMAFIAGAVAGAMRSSEALGAPLLFCVPLMIAALLVLTGNVPYSAIVALPEYRAVAGAWGRMLDSLPGTAGAYLRSLRPGWWLLRVVILVVAILVALRREVHGSFVLLPLIAIVLLVWRGKRARTDGRWRWIIAPANLFALGVGAALLVTGMADAGNRSNAVYYPPTDGIVNEGRYVENLYVFGPDGKPLAEAYLYDQNGRPVNMYSRRCEYEPRPSFDNRYPKIRVEYDPTGCHERSGVPFTIVIPQPSQPGSSTSSTPPSTPPVTSTPPSVPPPTK